MPDYISQNLTAIVIAVVGLFAGIAITIRYVKNANRDNSNKVEQINNKVGGDQAGRDITKR